MESLSIPGPVAEGTKIHKLNGYYYLSIPEGGVERGWQTILRSKNIYGPYEKKVVLEKGSTPINGPHQGAWIDLPNGGMVVYAFPKCEQYWASVPSATHAPGKTTGRKLVLISIGTESANLCMSGKNQMLERFAQFRRLRHPTSLIRRNLAFSGRGTTILLTGNGR